MTLARATRLLPVLAVLALGVAACGDAGDPPVTPAPTGAVVAEDPTEEETTEEEEVAEEPTEEPTEEADTTGTRESPMALGEMRQLAPSSAWTVGITEVNMDAAEAILSADEYAEGPGEGETFILATVTVIASAEKLEEQGVDIASEGAEPGFSVTVEYVGSDGKGYDGLTGTSCYTDNDLWNTGAVYEDGASVTGNVCISLPTDAVAGGLWRISNMENSAVWISVE